MPHYQEVVAVGADVIDEGLNLVAAKQPGAWAKPVPLRAPDGVLVQSAIVGVSSGVLFSRFLSRGNVPGRFLYHRDDIQRRAGPCCHINRHIHSPQGTLRPIKGSHKMLEHRLPLLYKARRMRTITKMAKI
jgi:hypothetical protein